MDEVGFTDGRFMRTCGLVLCLLSLLTPYRLQAVDLESLPRLAISDLIFEGAFRVPADTFGASDMNFSQGPIEYNPDNHSVFLVGHTHQQAIAEFSVPDLVKSSSVADLSFSPAPLQFFSTVLNRAGAGNSQNINTIGGLRYIRTGPHAGSLLIHGYEYYDAAGDNSHATLVVRNATDVSGSEVDGFYEFTVAPGHVAGWISPIPTVWQTALGGSYITGMSSGIPIISRTSVGPSAFAFEPTAILSQAEPGNPVAAVPLLDFSLGNPLQTDLSNSSGDNDMWTHLSRAIYGVIVPGTRTYLTIGHSGGHESGVCYKCTQNNGNTCGGYCAPGASDYYQYYWLWDASDFIKVKSGQLEPYEVQPYEYGPLPAAFESNELGGGTFDPVNGLLYLTVQRADRQQGTYSNPPVIVAYSFSPGSGDDEDGGGGDSGDASKKIGTFRNRTAWCVLLDGRIHSRIDRKQVPGKLQPARRGIRFFQKRLSRFNTSGRVVRRLRRGLRKARACRSGILFERKYSARR